MKYIDTVKILRELAKSNKYQVIFSSAKEVGLRLFKNTYNYTELQILFLNFLNFYSVINLDIILGEIEEIVLDNFIYEDSYMLYRKKLRSTKDENNMNPSMKYDNKQPKTATSTWVFKTPPKGVK